MKTRVFVFAALVAASLAVPSAAPAQEQFPSKPITVWVGFPAGGGTDILTRAAADGAEKSLGQKLVVVNKPGGGATVAATELAKARPDGYTIVGATDTPITRAPHLRPLEYDPFQHFIYLARLGRYKLTWVVRADSQLKTWRDLVEWARKNPDQLSFGHPGAGTTPHLVMAKIGAKEGFTFKSIPFPGDAPLVTALLGGHVIAAGTSSVAVTGGVQAGKIRVLHVNEREGLDYAPDATTFARAGYEIESSTSVLVLAPRAVPAAAAERLTAAFAEAIRSPAFLAVARQHELLLAPLTGTALMDEMRKVSTRYEELVKDAGIHKTQKK
jgi:tripartite-type tricarboxylate transporter receptor subunit TctC